MSEHTARSPYARRRFLARLSAVAAALGFGASAARAQTPTAPATPPPTDARFQPPRHAQDDWFDQIPGKHRLFLDSVSAQGAGDAILYANNFMSASKTAYGLDDADAAIVLCLRHNATAAAFPDSIWAKYGVTITEETRFMEPKTGQPPTINVYRSTAYGTALGNRGVTIDSVTKRGVQIAVCTLSTRLLSSLIARKTGSTMDEVFKELVASLLPNCRMVPAGIVAGSRAQERGYTVTYVG